MRSRGTPRTATQAATRGIGVMVTLGVTALLAAVAIALLLLWLVG